MFCRECGAENKENAVFCKECGARLTDNVKTRKSNTTIWVIVIIIVILIILAGVGFFFFKQKEKTNSESLAKSTSTEEAIADSQEELADTSTEVQEVVEEVAEMPVVYSDGIHEYSVIMADCTWDEAMARCAENGGHLVTFETDEEYQHVLTLIDDNRDNYYYVGGKCFEDRYYWIAPEGVNTTSSIEGRSGWMQGEPSYTDGTNVEDRMGIFYYKKENRWVWNDVPNSVLDVVDSYRGSLGYICEYE